jgi:hypothetical protein
MKRIHARFVLLMVSLIGVSQARASASIPQASTADYQAIETLLASYTRFVTEHDEAGFRALLLDEKIPFADVEESATSNNPPDLRQYEGFRQSVFASGQRFRQRFYNVRIEQHGALAQVSLDFVTEQGSGKRGSAAGWKVLQLVKVAGRWTLEDRQRALHVLAHTNRRATEPWEWLGHNAARRAHTAGRNRWQRQIAFASVLDLDSPK